MTDGIGILSLARFITGLMLGAAMPCMIAGTSDFVPATRHTRLIVLLSCAFSAGVAVSGAIAGVVMSASGWQALFWIGGVAPFLLVPVLYVVMPEAPALLIRQVRSGEMEALFRRFTSLRRPEPMVPAAVQKRLTSVTLLFRDGYAAPPLLIWLAYFCSGASLTFSPTGFQP